MPAGADETLIYCYTLRVKNVNAVTRELRRNLASGKWAEGDQFLTFDQLMHEYPDVLTNVYRVRTALAPLIEEGLLDSQHGSGTWVIRKPAEADANSAVREQLIEEILTELSVLRAKVETLRALR